MKNNYPIDKGRACVIIEKYQTSQIDQNTGQPIMKNRYATVGRVTKWPSNQPGQEPRVDIELDTLPLGSVSPIKILIFWDSEGQGVDKQKPGYEQQKQNIYEHKVDDHSYVKHNSQYNKDVY